MEKAFGHQILFFWYGTLFLGWDSARESDTITHLVPAGTGVFRVTYLQYAPDDADCCASLPSVTLAYRWIGHA